MAAPEPDGKVEIKVFKAEKLATLGRLPFDDKFCVELSLGDQLFRTETKSRNMGGLKRNVSWNVPSKFTFVGQMPDLTLQLFGQESDKKSIFIGRAILSYATLSSSGRPKIGTAEDYKLRLFDNNGEAILEPTTLAISVKFISLGDVELIDDITSALEQADLAVQHASEGLDQMQRLNIPGLSLGQGTMGSGVVGPAAAIGSILKAICTIADVMDELTKIHPYAKAAWDILDLTRKVIKAQMKEDDSIRELSEQMRSLLDRIRTFVQKLDSISSGIHRDEKDILQRVAHKSRDCAKFIISFCDKNFAKRVMKCALFGEAGQKIEGFKSEFSSLEKSFNEKVWDGTQIIAHQILENQKTNQQVLDRVDMTTQHMVVVHTVGRLQSEFMVRSASLLASDKQPCFTGTRVAIRKEITDWIDSVGEGVPRVLLLSGMAGTGKSTIAYTVMTECAKQGKLGTSFAFNRRAQPTHIASKLFPHIAASLATFYPVMKNSLAETQKKEIASGSNLEAQVRELVVEPLNRSMLLGVIVIVIDALDEADDDGAQSGKLASLLARYCSKLPPNIRILVTSRPEGHILEQMLDPTVLRLSMPDSSEINMSDVGLFVRDQLLSQPLKGIDEKCCDKLAETSQGLFQWAAIACNMIKPPLPMGSTSRKEYEMVVTSGRGRDKSGLLDSLYGDVLRRIGDPDKNPDGHQLLKQVLAMLFVLMELMTLDVLRTLYIQLGFGEESDVDSTLPYLASILDGISDLKRPVQPNHTSLRDFFLDPSRSGPFCVRDLLPMAHDRVARSSFKIMSTYLPQVANGIDFSHILDDTYLKSEADRFQQEIRAHMEYAILHCGEHLAEAPTPEEAFWSDIETSILTDDCVLPWVEVFCLLAIHRLNDLWTESSPELSGCIRFLAHIMKQQGSSCPSRIQSAAEHASAILGAERELFQFSFSQTVARLDQIYRSVAWTVKLQRQPENGPLVTIGSGFFLSLRGAQRDVILTSAHNLLDANGRPRADLVVNIPNQVPRLNGASRFSDIQFPVPPSAIHVCSDFPQRQQLETDWGAILLPRHTVLEEGFWFDVQLEDPGTMALGAYGQLSWIAHHHHYLHLNDSNDSVDIPHIPITTHVPVMNFRDPVTNGAPMCAFDSNDWPIYVRGICNPRYGDKAYTKLTPALIRELGSWLGFNRKSNTRLRWLPPVLSASPSWADLYLYVNEEDSRLYLKRSSGSSFDVSSLRGINSYFSNHGSLVSGSRLIDALDDKDDDGGWVACVSASDHKVGLHGLIVAIELHEDKDQQISRETLVLCHTFSHYFYVESTPTIGSRHGDSELFKISLRDWEDKEGSTRFETLNFAFE